MLDNKKASQIAFGLVFGVTVLLLSILFTGHLYASGVAKPASTLTSCESHNGIWSKENCDITVSSPYPLAKDKNHEKEHCCIPNNENTSNSEKGEIVGSDTISLDIAGKTLHVGDLIEVKNGNSPKIQVVKNMVEGDYCSITINAAKKVAGTIVVDDESTETFKLVESKSCVKGTVLDYGEQKFSKKGLYMIKVRVVDMGLRKEYGPYRSYINVTGKSS